MRVKELLTSCCANMGTRKRSLREDNRRFPACLVLFALAKFRFLGTRYHRLKERIYIGKIAFHPLEGGRDTVFLEGSTQRGFHLPRKGFVDRTLFAIQDWRRSA
jgi:hypothetical protein